MAYEIFPNIILFLAIIGILAIFFRHVPEAVAEGDVDNSSESGKNGGSEIQQKGFVGWLLKIGLNLRDGFGVAWKSTKKATGFVAGKVWHFMLEAKDLKQGQILASKFARMVKPSSLRYTQNSVHGPMHEAEELFTTGKYDQAEEKYFSIIAKFPHEYTAYEGLVKIYIQQKQYDNLEETLEYLVRHVPDNDSYLAQYGNALMSTRQYSAAIAAYNKSIAINELIPARFANLALSHQAIGDKAAAKDNFYKASELEPSNIQYLIMLADAMVALEQTEEALELLAKAKEMLPGDSEEISKQIRKIYSERS
jgi:tetratricopeptide (TPR) repeat protein